MQTVMTTNNGYDSILLVDDNDRVLSAWIMDTQTLRAYLADGAEANGWHEGEWPRGFDPSDDDNGDIADELRTISAYGVECGRNGQIADEGRRDFWCRDAA